MITFIRDIEINEANVETLKAWGERIKQKYRKQRYRPSIRVGPNDEIYVGENYSGDYYRYDEVKKYLGQTIPSILKGTIMQHLTSLYCDKNKYQVQQPVYNHHQFIRLAYIALLPIRLKEAIPQFYDFNMWNLYKYEGGIGFAVNFEPDQPRRARKGVHCFEYVMRYPDMSTSIGLTGTGPKNEKARWNTFVVLHTLMVDILKFLDSEYEKAGGVAENVAPEVLEQWIRSQVPVEEVDKVIREITNPFGGDAWRSLYEDLKRMCDQ